MCSILEADCFFSILLSHTERINLDRIIEIRDSIQAQKSDIVINISGSSIHRAIHYYPLFFILEGSAVCRGQQFNTDQPMRFVKKEFSNEVSEAVLDQVDRLVSQSIAG